MLLHKGCKKGLLGGVKTRAPAMGTPLLPPVPMCDLYHHALSMKRTAYPDKRKLGSFFSFDDDKGGIFDGGNVRGKDELFFDGDVRQVLCRVDRQDGLDRRQLDRPRLLVPIGDGAAVAGLGVKDPALQGKSDLFFGPLE